MDKSSTSEFSGFSSAEVDSDYEPLSKKQKRIWTAKLAICNSEHTVSKTINDDSDIAMTDDALSSGSEYKPTRHEKKKLLKSGSSLDIDTSESSLGLDKSCVVNNDLKSKTKKSCKRIKNERNKSSIATVKKKKKKVRPDKKPMRGALKKQLNDAVQINVHIDGELPADSNGMVRDDLNADIGVNRGSDENLVLERGEINVHIDGELPADSDDMVRDDLNADMGVNRGSDENLGLERGEMNVHIDGELPADSNDMVRDDLNADMGVNRGSDENLGLERGEINVHIDGELPADSNDMVRDDLNADIVVNRGSDENLGLERGEMNVHIDGELPADSNDMVRDDMNADMGLNRGSDENLGLEIGEINVHIDGELPADSNGMVRDDLNADIVVNRGSDENLGLEIGEINVHIDGELPADSNDMVRDDLNADIVVNRGSDENLGLEISEINVHIDGELPAYINDMVRDDLNADMGVYRGSDENLGLEIGEINVHIDAELPADSNDMVRDDLNADIVVNRGSDENLGLEIGEINVHIDGELPADSNDMVRDDLNVDIVVNRGSDENLGLEIGEINVHIDGELPADSNDMVRDDLNADIVVNRGSDENLGLERGEINVHINGELPADSNGMVRDDLNADIVVNRGSDENLGLERGEINVHIDGELLVGSNNIVMDDTETGAETILYMATALDGDMDNEFDVNMDLATALDGNVCAEIELDVNGDIERVIDVNMGGETDFNVTVDGGAEHLDKTIGTKTTCENNDREGIIRTGRKKRKDEKSWARNIRKRCINSGHHYGGVGSKKKQKILKKGCGSNCRLKCHQHFSEQTREEIFHKYWGLGDITRQRDFLLKYTEVSEKRITKVKGLSRRSQTIQWTLPLLDKPQRVCKTFFLHTLSVSDQMISTAFQKNNIGMSSSDGRGKHNNRPTKTSFSKLNQVRAHIDSFSRVESHYCRKDSKKQYLPAGLNISRMYRMYRESCSEPVSFSIYRRVFDNDFNLSFHIPRKDQCDLCTKYSNSNETEKEEMKAEYDNHIINKEMSREHKAADKEKAIINSENSDFVAACFDLEEVLMTPKSFESAIYYKRRLNTYNMTIYNLGNKDGYSYIWNETVSHRGGCEIASCVYSFLKTMSESRKKHIVLYSDNCCGQNKNRFCTAMLWYALNKFKFSTIEHKFLEKGHTQNENDSMHAGIESRCKNVPVYTTPQWATTVRLTRSANPYIVKEMSLADFYYNFGEVCDVLKNFDLDVDRKKVYWSGVRTFKMTLEDPNVIEFKYNYDGPTHKLNLTQRLRRSIETPDPSNIILGQLRDDYIPLKKQKFDDLMSLCRDKIIPTVHHAFYILLPHTITESDED